MLLAAIATITLYQNCSSNHQAPDGSADNDSSTGFEDVDMAKSLVAFERSLYPITQEVGLCIECHGVDQQPLHSLDDPTLAHEVMIGFGLVNLRDPISSVIVDKIRSGSHNNAQHNNIDPAVADRLEQAITDWSDELVANGGLIGVGAGVQPTYTSLFTNVIEAKCVSCHSPDGAAPNIDYSDYVNTINTGRVVPGNAGASLMFSSTSNQSEPRGGDTPLTVEELNALRDWINRGALNN